jgi:Ca-activated chloride channel homolog
MFGFAWPWMFLVLPLPWLVHRLLPSRAPSRALHLPYRGLDLPGPGSARFMYRSWKSVWWTLVWLALVTAAARPQWIGSAQPQQRSGRGVMLAVDMSGSMSTKDMKLGGNEVSRFGAVRVIAGQFIDRRKGDEVGLILFGTHAYLVTPLTYDLDAVRAQLRDVAVGLAGRNTAIGDAIGVAVRRLRKLPGDERVLILLTDGVNNAGAIAPLQAARIARKAGVRIYTIGIGSNQPAIPGFLGQVFGNPGSSLDVGVLKKIADMTGGHFYRASDSSQLVAAYRAIDALEPTLQGKIMRRPYRPLYPWPLGLAMLLAWVAWWSAAKVPEEASA